MKYLIAITTCNRLDEVRKNIASYLHFCYENKQFDFVLSLDGNEDHYVHFCEQYKIPLIWSEEREGVGVSKNRICKLFPDYESYFFIEDDVILYDSRIFRLLIELSGKLNIHHFSRTHTIGILKKEKTEKYTIMHSSYGDGSFLFYTREALNAIGGWHSAFVKYRRFGHTEHTYRVFQNNLNPSPFVFPRQADFMIIVDTPPSVTKVQNVHVNPNGLIDEEQDLINSKLKYFHFETPSAIWKNKYAENITEKNYVIPVSGYYDVSRREKRKAMSLRYFHKFKISGNPIFLFISFIYDRRQVHLKNYMMIQWISMKERTRKKKNK